MIASNDRAEAKRRVRAKLEAHKALPAAERIANTLHATHTHADAQALLDEVRNAARAEVVAEVAEFLSEIGTPITGERTEHERGVMYAARRVAEQFGGAR